MNHKMRYNTNVVILNRCFTEFQREAHSSSALSALLVTSRFLQIQTRNSWLVGYISDHSFLCPKIYISLSAKVSLVDAKTPIGYQCDVIEGPLFLLFGVLVWVFLFFYHFTTYEFSFIWSDPNESGVSKTQEAMKSKEKHH